MMGSKSYRGDWVDLEFIGFLQGRKQPHWSESLLAARCEALRAGRREAHVEICLAVRSEIVSALAHEHDHEKLPDSRLSEWCAAAAARLLARSDALVVEYDPGDPL